MKIGNALVTCPSFKSRYRRPYIQGPARKAPKKKNRREKMTIKTNLNRLTGVKIVTSIGGNGKLTVVPKLMALL